LSREHSGDVVVVDTDPARRERARSLPWIAHAVAAAAAPQQAFDVAFHATGTGAGLQCAIDLLGFEGRVLELSWYGRQSVTLQLGGRFHRERQRIVASQVGTLARAYRDQGRAARTLRVLELLAAEDLDALVQDTVPFAELPDFCARLYRGEALPPCPVVEYPGAR
jgi:threonine dehydrogenase-like Zn-dependent dehydrogenase